MTTTELRDAVRNLLDQTSTSNTQFSNTMIDRIGNQARKAFASILPARLLRRLRKSAALTVTAGVGAYPSDYLRPVDQPYVIIDTLTAVRIPDEETWRLRYLDDNSLVKSGGSQKYFQELENGVKLWPTSATACTYEYYKIPDDLSGSDNKELPESIDDLVIDFTFRKLMGTQRGDMELAQYLFGEERRFIERLA